MIGPADSGLLPTPKTFFSVHILFQSAEQSLLYLHSLKSKSYPEQNSTGKTSVYTALTTMCLP
jgi:hypothetical protein